MFSKMDFLLFPLPSPPPPSPSMPYMIIWKPANRVQFSPIYQIIISHRTDAFEIVKGQWPQRNFYAFFSSISLPWEVLPTVTTTAIVPSVSPVVQIKSVDRHITTVRTTTSVAEMLQ